MKRANANKTNLTSNFIDFYDFSKVLDGFECEEKDKYVKCIYPIADNCKIEIVSFEKGEVVNIVFGCININARLMHTESHEYFIALHSVKGKDGKYYDQATIYSKEFWKLCKEICKHYFEY